MNTSNLSKFLGVEILDADENCAHAVLPFREDLADLSGHMSGCAYATLGDAAAQALARANGSIYTMQTYSIQFFASTTAEDEVLLAKAEIRHRGSRTCIIHVEFTHRDGKLAGDGQYSLAKIG